MILETTFLVGLVAALSVFAIILSAFFVTYKAIQRKRIGEQRLKRFMVQSVQPEFVALNPDFEQSEIKKCNCLKGEESSNPYKLTVCSCNCQELQIIHPSISSTIFTFNKGKAKKVTEDEENPI